MMCLSSKLFCFYMKSIKIVLGTGILCISPSVLVWHGAQPTSKNKNSQALYSDQLESAGGSGSNPVQKHEKKDTARDPGMLILHFSI